MSKKAKITLTQPGTALIAYHPNEGEASFGLFAMEPEGLPMYRATVLAVADDVTEVKPGDEVIAARYAAEPLPSFGRKKNPVGIIKVSDIEVVLEEKEVEDVGGHPDNVHYGE